MQDRMTVKRRPWPQPQLQLREQSNQGRPSKKHPEWRLRHQAK